MTRHKLFQITTHVLVGCLLLQDVSAASFEFRGSSSGFTPVELQTRNAQLATLFQDEAIPARAREFKSNPSVTASEWKSEAAQRARLSAGGRSALGITPSHFKGMPPEILWDAGKFNTSLIGHMVREATRRTSETVGEEIEGLLFGRIRRLAQWQPGIDRNAPIQIGLVHSGVLPDQKVVNAFAAELKTILERIEGVTLRESKKAGRFFMQVGRWPIPIFIFSADEATSVAERVFLDILKDYPDRKTHEALLKFLYYADPLGNVYESFLDAIDRGDWPPPQIADYEPELRMLEQNRHRFLHRILTRLRHTSVQPFLPHRDATEPVEESVLTAALELIRYTPGFRGSKSFHELLQALAKSGDIWYADLPKGTSLAWRLENGRFRIFIDRHLQPLFQKEPHNEAHRTAIAFLSAKLLHETAEIVMESHRSVDWNRGDDDPSIFSTETVAYRTELRFLSRIPGFLPAFERLVQDDPPLLALYRTYLPRVRTQSLERRFARQPKPLRDYIQHLGYAGNPNSALIGKLEKLIGQENISTKILTRIFEHPDRAELVRPPMTDSHFFSAVEHVIGKSASDIQADLQHAIVRRRRTRFGLERMDANGQPVWVTMDTTLGRFDILPDPTGHDPRIVQRIGLPQYQLQIWLDGARIDGFSGTSTSLFSWRLDPGRELVELTNIELIQDLHYKGVGQLLTYWLARRAADMNYWFGINRTDNPVELAVVEHVLDPDSLNIEVFNDHVGGHDHEGFMGRWEKSTPQTLLRDVGFITVMDGTDRQHRITFDEGYSRIDWDRLTDSSGNPLSFSDWRGQARQTLELIDGHLPRVYDPVLTDKNNDPLAYKVRFERHVRVTGRLNVAYDSTILIPAQRRESLVASPAGRYADGKSSDEIDSQFQKGYQAEQLKQRRFAEEQIYVYEQALGTYAGVFLHADLGTLIRYDASSLIPTQDSVTVTKLDVEQIKHDLWVKYGWPNIPIVVLDLGRRKYILDGHHRAYLAAKNNESVLAYTIRIEPQREFNIHELTSIHDRFSRYDRWRIADLPIQPDTSEWEYLLMNLKYHLPSIAQQIFSEMAFLGSASVRAFFEKSSAILARNDPDWKFQDIVLALDAIPGSLLNIADTSIEVTSEIFHWSAEHFALTRPIDGSGHIKLRSGIILHAA